MNIMLEINHKVVKRLKTEVERKQELDRINDDDMLWVNELSSKGTICPVRIIM
jgi:hypothetical protein